MNHTTTTQSRWRAKGLAALKTLVLLCLCTLTGNKAFSQTTADVIMTNDVQVSPTELQVDIIIRSTGASSFQLSGNQYGINYNSAIKNGGTISAAWVTGSTELSNPAQLSTSFNTTTNPSQIRIAAPPAPGAGNGSIIPTGAGSRVGRLRIINTVAFASAQANLAFNFTSNSTSTRTSISWYNGTTNTVFCNPPVITISCTGTSTYINTTTNPVLNPPSCTAPTLSASVTNETCLGDGNGAIDLTITGGTPTPLSIAWSNGASTEDLSALSGGTYTVTVTTQGGNCSATASYTVAPGAAPATNTSNESACDSYTWSANGTTYTQSGSYTSINGCNTNILNLTITPSSSNTTTASACDSYTWSVNGNTYSQSGTYSSVNGCHTEFLNLTITPSTTNTTTISACDSYTWSVDGNTYTQSGTFSSTNGCATEILSLTITPSSSNSTTASACDSYTWSVNGTSYTQSGTYSSVNGCLTEILNLTITPSVYNTVTAAACGSYTWSVNGQTYSQSGSYTVANGCNFDVLNLTITPTPAPVTLFNTGFNSGEGFAVGDINGQNGWSTYDPTSTTGGGNFALITATAPAGFGGDQAVQFSSGTSSATSPRYAWGADYSSGFSAASGDGKDLLVVTNKIYIPSGSTSSARSGLITFDATGTKILAGYVVQHGTGAVYLMANFNNAGTINNFSFNTGATITYDQWVEFTTTWNKVTGRMQVFFGSNGFFVDGAAAGSIAAETDLYNTRNSGTIAATAFYDDLKVEAHLPVLPVPDTLVATGCDSYSWATNGQTYTQGGTYNYTDNQCNEHVLILTVLPSSTNTTTASACISYTWSVNNTAYTQSGTYTAVNGCVTEVLNLTVTPQPQQPTLACWETATFNNQTCSWDVTGSQPAQPNTACYETASFNTQTCSWDVTGTQPQQPQTACWETATFNNQTCSWDVTGSQPQQPTLACYETASFNTQSCQWDVTGTQPQQPQTACWETATFNNQTCSWDVTGSQPQQPTLACYETASFNTQSCQWDVTGTQPQQPQTACYETATFNNTTCSWDVTGSPAAPIVTTESACGSYTWTADGNTYTASGTYSFYGNCQDYVLNLTVNPAFVNTTTDTACQSYTWTVTGVTYTQSGTYSSVTGCTTDILNLTIYTPPTAFITNSTTSFNTAEGFVPGGINGQNGWNTYDPTFTSGGGTFASVTTTAPAGFTGDQSVAFQSGTGSTSSPRYAWGPAFGTAFDAAASAGKDLLVVTTKQYVPSGSTSTARTGMITYDATGSKILTGYYVQQNTGVVYLLANYDNSGTIGNFAFNTGATLGFNTWTDVTTTWNKTTGRMEVFWGSNGFFVDGAGAGSIADETDYYSTRNASTIATTNYFDDLAIQFYNPNGIPGPDTTTASACDSYTWAVNGQTYTQTGTYNYTNNKCEQFVLDVTVTPSSTNTTSINACVSYNWSANNTTYTESGAYTAVVGCVTEILNLSITPQPQQPQTACWETATFNNQTCQWDVTGTQPAQPTLACYETASFNTTTCSWDVTGTQPAQPNTTCYETATFNTQTCSWDVTGTQPAQPTLACYETATFNGQTCQWDVTGTQPAQPNTACYETATFNTTTCSWDVTGTQPAQPNTACWETATFNNQTCSWDVTGTQPAQPNTACYETATFNTTTCQWDVTGTQPAQPNTACYETATFNGQTCQWDVTGTQPAQPTLACYETASFNTTTCQWDVTGTQPAQPNTACYETATFNTTTCSWDVTGTQPAQPNTACYETATFNGQTCQWDVTGTQPAQPNTACYETATFNTTTCQWDVTGTQPAQPNTACYETATFNSQTCQWDVTGTQPAQPNTACYETATFNGQTCQWDVTGTQPAQPNTACYETATFNGQTCQWDVTGTQPAQPNTACYETATFNTTTCQWDVTGTQPAQPNTACYETATFNNQTCSWDVTGTQPAQPTLACYETASFNGQTCQWDVTGSPAQAITTNASAFDSYTWSVNGQTYTASGTYSFNSNCQDYVLVLTVTATVTNTTTASACDSYTWSVNNTTYTQSGTYSSTTPGLNEVLVLTITASSSNTTTASACDGYTWSVTGTTYTQSGTYSSVNGCHTEYLVLTITGVASTNNSTASACDSYTWAVNNTAYSQSGTYSYVNGCDTYILNLTVTPSSSNTTQASACDSYTWSYNGTTYTQSGSYSVVTGCHTENLVLTITPSSSNTTTESVCDSYTWGVNNTTYTQSGTYSVVTGCHTETLVLSVTPSSSNSTTESVCDSYTWSVNGQTYTASGTYSVVTGCHTETLVLTVTPSSSNTTTESACDSYTWDYNGVTYTQSGTYVKTNGCHTETLNLTINASPSASATSGSITCAGQTTTVTVTASGGTAPYTGTGNFTEEAGTYSYTVTDANGCTAQTGISITEPTPLVVTANAGTILCTGGSTTVAVSATGGTAPYSGTGTFTVTAGTYTYTVADANQCSEQQTVVIVDPAPLGNPSSINGTAQACLPGTAGSMTFNVPPVTSAASYVWTAPAGTTISAGQGTATVTISWTAASVQAGIAGTLCVYAMDACGSTSTTSCTNVGYQIAKPVTPGSISGPSNLCAGVTGTFSIATVARATSYSWTVPANMQITSGQGTNVINVIATAGFSGGNVVVTADNMCGASLPRTKALTPGVAPGVPTAITGKRSGLCNQSGVVYTITAVSGATSYLWSVTGGTIVSGQGTTSVTVNFGTLTSGSISVSSVNACASSLPRTASLTGAPGISTVITGLTNVCRLSQQPYSVSTVDGATNYTWTTSVAGQVLQNGTKNAIVRWNSASTNQTVSVRTSNACGNSPLRSLLGITVAICARVDANAFSLNAYPNPTAGRLTVTFDVPESGDYRMRITDISGRVVMAEELGLISGYQQRDLDLSAYSSGMYFVVLESNDNIQTIRVTVEK